MTTTVTPRVTISRAAHRSNVRRFGTRFRLFKDQEARDCRHFDGSPIMHPKDKRRNQCDPLLRQIVEDLFVVDGIESIRAKAFELEVSCGLAFDWSKLEGLVQWLIATSDPVVADGVLVDPPPYLKPQRIRWVGCSFEDSRDYALTVKIYSPEYSMDDSFAYPIDFDGGSRTPNFMAGGRELLDRLAEIDGIKWLSVDPWCVRIYRYRHFAWSDMDDQIFDALRQAFPDPDAVQVEQKKE